MNEVENHVSGSAIVEEKRKSTYDPARYRRNRKKMIAAARKWQKENPDKFKEAGKKWRKDNKEHLEAYWRKYHKDNYKKVNKEEMKKQVEQIDDFFNPCNLKNNKKQQLHEARKWRNRNHCVKEKPLSYGDNLKFQKAIKEINVEEFMNMLDKEIA
jgi:hypothetical protein